MVGFHYITAPSTAPELEQIQWAKKLMFENDMITPVCFVNSLQVQVHQKRTEDPL